jgi:hypothetical protein
VSRRQTPHVKREKSRERRALDRAIIRAVRGLTWTGGTERPFALDAKSLAELVGLSIARSRI